MTTANVPQIMPSESDLEMWPYVHSDSPLWSLDYAEIISEAIAGHDDYEFPLWHETMGWLFDICSAWYALAAATTVLEYFESIRILDQLQHMQFRMSPLFRDADSLDDTARDAFNILEAQVYWDQE